MKKFLMPRVEPRVPAQFTEICVIIVPVSCLSRMFPPCWIISDSNVASVKQTRSPAVVEKPALPSGLHQSLDYQTPDDVYASASGGGARIVDKFDEMGQRLSAA